MNEISKIEKEIEDKKKELAALKSREAIAKRESVIKKLSEYTIEEKVKFFDKMYDAALTQLIEQEGSNPKIELDTHYDWEEKMTILARNTNTFWNYWNSLTK